MNFLLLLAGRRHARRDAQRLFQRPGVRLALADDVDDRQPFVIPAKVTRRVIGNSCHRASAAISRSRLGSVSSSRTSATTVSACCDGNFA